MTQSPVEDAIAALREIKSYGLPPAGLKMDEATWSLFSTIEEVVDVALARLTVEQAETTTFCVCDLSGDVEHCPKGFCEIHQSGDFQAPAIVAKIIAGYKERLTAEQAKVPPDREKLIDRCIEWAYLLPAGWEKKLLLDCAAALRHPAPAECETMAKLLDDTHTWQGDAAAALIRRLAPADGWRPTLREANEKRQAEWDADNQISLAYRGNELAGEVGEACNIIKKLERERIGIRGSRATKQQLAEELADVVICADLIAMSENIDLLGRAVPEKFNATSEKYGLATRLPSPPAEEETP